MASPEERYPKLTLNEKLWLQKRAEALQKQVFVGSVLGGSSMIGLSIYFSKRLTRFHQLGFAGLGVTIGAIAGYLQADSAALRDLEASSNTDTLKRQMRELASDIQASKK